MNLTKREKMKILLEQLQLPDDVIENHFEQSALHKLVVHKHKKVWHFHIELDQTLPLTVYEMLMKGLQETFKDIASVELTLEVKNKEEATTLVTDYWRHFIRQTPALLPNHLNVLLQQDVQLNDNQLIVQVKTEAEAVALQKRLLEPFKTYCTKVGLQPYQLVIKGNTAVQEIETFRQQTNEEDRENARNTMIKQQEQLDKHNQEPVIAKVQLGYAIPDEPVQMEEIMEEERRITVQGYIFNAEVRKLRSGRSLLLVKATDYTDSLEIKMFSRNDEDAEMFNAVKAGIWIKARGRIQTDMYSNELTMMANDIEQVDVATRMDDAEDGKKRVELHAHTTMSQLDAVVSPARLVETAAKWGHEAIAITDHAAVQGFPEAFMTAKKHGIKVIYGLEANVVDDGVPIAYQPADLLLKDQTYVVFDVETTGLSSVYDTIIELAGVKIYQGEIVDRFESFANPHRPLPDKIIEITGITDDMLVGSPEVGDVLQDFHKWVGNDVLVAHNATFDIGFLNQGYSKIGIERVRNPVIDTLELARFLLPNLGNHRLNTLCKHFNVELTQHHRAIYDAEATGYLFWKLVEQLKEHDIDNINQLNDHMGEGDSYQHGRPFHATLLVQNETGLKNLYKLVSKSLTEYFYRVPRIPRSLLSKHREGILIGSACDNGEIFDACLQKSVDEVKDLVSFYDYLEIQPPENYYHLIERELVQTKAQILES